MSVVEQMVCPACARMHGQEHDEDCPWNGLTGGVSPQPGVSEAYLWKKATGLVGPARDDGDEEQ